MFNTVVVFLSRIKQAQIYEVIFIRSFNEKFERF
jgi:hypothetical protein